MTNEQRIELCNKINENLKNKDSYLIENDKDFRKLISSKILTFNDKIGSKYFGYLLISKQSIIFFSDVIDSIIWSPDDITDNILLLFFK